MVGGGPHPAKGTSQTVLSWSVVALILLKAPVRLCCHGRWWPSSVRLCHCVPRSCSAFRDALVIYRITLNHLPMSYPTIPACPMLLTVIGHSAMCGAYGWRVLRVGARPWSGRREHPSAILPGQTNMAPTSTGLWLAGQDVVISHNGVF